MIQTDEDQVTLADAYKDILEQIRMFLVGNQLVLDLLIVALLSRGHILIEGTPGTAKTTIVKTIAQLSGCKFKRVQCAVDIQPADILGVRIFDQEMKQFDLRKGPIFTNFLLIDELNRLTPKTQSAFIEAMSERQVTIDGETNALNEPFFAVATQNPCEYEGTFPLIEAEKDRFMFSIPVRYLDADEELELIHRESTGSLDWDKYVEQIHPILNPATVQRLQNSVMHVGMEEPVLMYIRDIVMATRSHGDVQTGASSRASIYLIRGSRAYAALQGREYVIPDDVKKIAPFVLQHRIVLDRVAEISGITPGSVIEQILSSVEVL